MGKQNVPKTYSIQFSKVIAFHTYLIVKWVHHLIDKNWAVLSEGLEYQEGHCLHLEGWNEVYGQSEHTKITQPF